MDTLAVVIDAPRALELRRLPLTEPAPDHLVVDVEWSGISTGTERLLYAGRMPHFPGMGYPLVPGYETVGHVARAAGDFAVGDRVFVPGASCFGDVRGLFGGAAARLVVPAARAVKIDQDLGAEGVLLSLAATAYHALAGGSADLIVGHGVLGRLLARLSGGTATVWERDPVRAAGAEGYTVVDPADDPRRDYRTIVDASGDGGLIEPLIGRLARGGELVLAGFYADPITFAYPPAFLKEARLRVAAEWQPADLAAVAARVRDGSLRLDGLVTHRRPAAEAADAYAVAFGDPACLKMLLDWRDA